ncbi:hypothetical protein AMATHDRAFT_139661 [Amanita thiersii Skay4041]|uniref:ACB domain-containing protein n=1 Tax=Amanita thiersii Skay4041 TaxID=703135 RepID=A0A2A9NR76_9AGAR|nr:hypothetical protein AMATHDRAFT_139661 [Amanita thiersii Skay4041]
MASKQLIDAQFDRAVEIVQGLPKTGPIQTDYEEKLTMYRYATVGNVKSPRPGIWDMLGRAKWDAWAKHKDLDPYEAKWLYVEALLKVLRRYSDRTVAKSLVDELESYRGDPSNIVLSQTLEPTSRSDSSGSSASNEALHPPYPRTMMSRQQAEQEHEIPSSEEEREEEPGELPPAANIPLSHLGRPSSSMSSHRYRTPLAGSHITSPPLPLGIPEMQPRPSFETLSAFPGPESSRTPGASALFQSSYIGQLSDPSRSGLLSPPAVYPTQPHFRAHSQSVPGHLGPGRPPSRLTLERAVESMQAHIAALTERIETLEASSRYLSRSLAPPSSRGTSPNNGRARPQWDINDLGLWSIVLNPVSNTVDAIRNAIRFLARDEARSPFAVVVRRLCLDFSFLLCAVVITRFLWRESGSRRKEVRAALKMLWRAVLGTRQRRIMVDEGV